MKLFAFDHTISCMFVIKLEAMNEQHYFLGSPALLIFRFYELIPRWSTIQQKSEQIDMYSSGKDRKHPTQRRDLQISREHNVVIKPLLIFVKKSRVQRSGGRGEYKPLQEHTQTRKREKI